MNLSERKDSGVMRNINLQTVLCFNGTPYVKVSEMYQVINSQLAARNEILIKEMKEQIGMSGEHMDNKLCEWIERLEKGELNE